MSRFGWDPCGIFIKPWIPLSCFESFSRKDSLNVVLNNISVVTVAICSSCKFYKCVLKE